MGECLQFKKNGYFLDFGAFDGKLTSNTYALEHDLGWRGICVEPNPKHYAAVCECRRCIAVNVALWPQSREQLRFVEAHGFSSLERFKDADANAKKRAEATSEVIQVDTLNPTELLRRFKAPKLIDYLTLDVEGAELDVLQALDLNEYAIALMTIEHNHDAPRKEKIRQHLAQYGYECFQNRNDDYFFHRQHLVRLLPPGQPTPDPVATFKRIDTIYRIGELNDIRPGQKSTVPPATPPKPPGVPLVMNIPSPPSLKPSPSESFELPKLEDAMREHADILYENGAWNDAIQVYKILAGQFPDDMEVLRRRIACSEKLGHTVLAQLIREEALERHPEWASKI